jgi:hypothetical protein
MAVVSDASILKVVTRVLKVQHCTAHVTAVGSDAYFRMAAATVLRVQHCFA